MCFFKNSIQTMKLTVISRKILLIVNTHYHVNDLVIQML